MADDNEKPKQEDAQLATWYKKMELIVVDIKSLDRENETGRLKLRTTFMNQHFINELDKICLQLVKITAGGIFSHGFIVPLESKSQE